MRKLFGLDAAAHSERAAKYERIGKLGMARLELEQALEAISLTDAKGREKINQSLDRLTLLEQEDAESRIDTALSHDDLKSARYYLNVALSKLDEGHPAYQRMAEILDSLPEDQEEAALVDELSDILKADVGVDFLDRQRALEFWKSGFPPYKEDYYLNKALTSDKVRTLLEHVQRHPEDADACFNFGITLAQLGLVDKALVEIRRFVSLKPEDRDGHYLLANLLADQGFDDEAIREFERAIEIDPEFLEAYYYLAVHYCSLQDWERAQKLFLHMVDAGTENELVEEARHQLETIAHHVRGQAE